jgi:transposase-like zinc-binding protein
VEISWRVYKPRRPRESPLFARLWCSGCRRSVLVAFSCRGRSLCPSCEKKKQLLWAEWLREEFSAHVGEALFSQDKQRLEDTAAYLVRNPLLCGRPHRSGYADLAIMRTIACAGTGVTRQYSEMRAVVDSRWSA